LRYTRAAQKEMSLEDLYEESYDRMEESDDINFIDGFMMMYQVYPKYLDHTYGMDHLSILLRPIPRNLWPGKPLAGWFQNYQEKYGTQKSTIGFSPTLYGVFYSEGGVVGIIILSVLWAYALAWTYRNFSAYKSDISYILIGVFLTALIPIFRSGDLPGDFAIVLLSYWPIILFTYKYRQFVKKRIQREQ
jgi:oligosaccharide repeat unit polymerase